MTSKQQGEVEVVNRQRRRKIETGRWVDFASGVLRAIGKENAGLTIAFVSDRKMREFNRAFRKIDRTTDVLSFPAGKSAWETTGEQELGDIAISVDRAKVQAKENGLRFDQEIAQLILHGVLHLSGYDHETDNGEMNRLELRLRRTLGLENRKP